MRNKEENGKEGGEKEQWQKEGRKRGVRGR